MSNPWYRAEGEEGIPSPALLIFPKRIEENVRRMIEITDSVERLRPHLKTHKMAEVTRMQLAAGISKFKCATIAEAEMGANCGAKEILLAYPSVGPRVKQLRQLAERFPEVRFSTLIDCSAHLTILSDAFAGAKKPCEVFLDLDCGMGRTGIKADREALQLYREILILDPSHTNARQQVAVWEKREPGDRRQETEGRGRRGGGASGRPYTHLSDLAAKQ